MEQHSERPDPRPGQEPEIPAPGDAGEALAEVALAEVAAAGYDADAGAGPDRAAFGLEEHAGADEHPGAGQYTDTEEDTGAVGWDMGDDADAEWGSQEDADVAVPDESEQRPATGEPRVDAALARLDELPGRPVTEHRAIFEDVHRRLRDVLGELDTREHDSGNEPAGAGAERRASR